MIPRSHSAIETAGESRPHFPGFALPLWSKVGKAVKVLFFLFGLAFSLMVSQAGSQELYKWTDETGKVNIVDDMSMVPERYRDTIKIYPISPVVMKRPSIEKEEVSESASDMVREEEQPEPATLTPEERDARIEALQNQKDELEKERRRQWILQERFGSIGSARATFYKKRVEKLDEQIEAVQKDLDAIH
ncbi:MAG: DUF4124 domain-containing protein [Proteobacteria bacterium]|nr:DUF4124 domain-containing protein [Pseudomonadota bacterium]